MRLLIPALFSAALLILPVSCDKTPDENAIRSFIYASQAYAAGNFMEVSGILGNENQFPPSLILRAKAEYFSDEIETAEKSFRRALKLHPSSFEAKLFLARILYEKDDMRGAVRLTETILNDDPQNIRALRLAAELANVSGKTDEAAAFLDRAAEFSAESAMVLLDRARLRWTAGNVYGALEDLSRAKAMLPWDTMLLRAITNLENTIKESLQ